MSTFATVMRAMPPKELRAMFAQMVRDNADAIAAVIVSCMLKPDSIKPLVTPTKSKSKNAKRKAKRGSSVSTASTTSDTERKGRFFKAHRVAVEEAAQNGKVFCPHTGKAVDGESDRVLRTYALVPCDEAHIAVNPAKADELKPAPTKAVVKEARMLLLLQKAVLAHSHDTIYDVTTGRAVQKLPKKHVQGHIGDTPIAGKKGEEKFDELCSYFEDSAHFAEEDASDSSESEEESVALDEKRIAKIEAGLLKAEQAEKAYNVSTSRVVQKGRPALVYQDIENSTLACKKGDEGILEAILEHISPNDSDYELEDEEEVEEESDSE